MLSEQSAPNVQVNLIARPQLATRNNVGFTPLTGKGPGILGAASALGCFTE